MALLPKLQQIYTNVRGAIDWHINMNSSLGAIDVLLQGTFTEFRTAPPDTPASGDTFIVLATATGAFEGKEGKIAHYRNGEWAYYTPFSGWSMFNSTTRIRHTYLGNETWCPEFGHGAATSRPAANGQNMGCFWRATDTNAVYFNRQGSGWDLFSSGYVAGVLADRPAASEYYSGVNYFATDQNGGTRYRCSFVSSAWAWVKQAKGATESSDGGSTALIPETEGAPEDSPSISGGHPVRFDPVTRRLYVFEGTNWYKTQMVVSVPGLGAIDGIVGWWVAEDSAVGGGSNLPSLVGRIGPTLDAVGASEPTIAAAAVNGKKAINFGSTGSGQNLRVPTNPFSGATAGELFYVLKSGASPAGTSEWNGPKWTTSTEAGHYPYTGSTIYLNALRNTRVSFGFGGVDIGDWHVLRVQSHSNYKVQLDGTTVYDSATGAFAVQSVPLITGGAGDLQVAAVIAFDTSAKAGGVLTTDEYADVKAWILSQFAISLP